MAYTLALVVARPWEHLARRVGRLWHVVVGDIGHLFEGTEERCSLGMEVAAVVVVVVVFRQTGKDLGEVQAVDTPCCCGVSGVAPAGIVGEHIHKLAEP